MIRNGFYLADFFVIDKYYNINITTRRNEVRAVQPPAESATKILSRVEEEGGEGGGRRGRDGRETRGKKNWELRAARQADPAGFARTQKSSEVRPA